SKSISNIRRYTLLTITLSMTLCLNACGVKEKLNTEEDIKKALETLVDSLTLEEYIALRKFPLLQGDELGFGAAENELQAAKNKIKRNLSGLLVEYKSTFKFDTRDRNEINALLNSKIKVAKLLKIMDACRHIALKHKQ
ncbi:MAG: hypothetical protein AAFP93_02555, partial [Bacteroidota bacterium]